MTAAQRQLSPASQWRNRPIPKPFAYPSDYGLAGASQRLVDDYGRVGAINRLIEMAERLEAGGDPFAVLAGKRRIELPA